MEVFEWHDGEVPDTLQVKQVYGLAFTRDGRVLLRTDGEGRRDAYNLAGGKPEKIDDGYVGTLRREFFEEVNVELDDETFVAGYFEVHEPSGIPPYAQMRMVAIIKNIGVKMPDPDGGIIYDRVLTTPKRALELLNWGKSGEKMMSAAVKILREKFNITETSTAEEYV